jgi:tetratricopeptide (TPR) repeat protein
MKKYFLFILLIICASRAAMAGNPIDSLKQKLQVTTNDSLKAYLYTELAAQYMHYDTIRNRYQRFSNQNDALNYTMLALHLFSRYNDTIGLRICFNNLARVYHSQRKYSQAKWFILQSNTLSREKKDVQNIIASLLELAAIKTDIKDFKLAMQDLDEARLLAKVNYLPLREADVEMGFATVYARLNEKDKAILALKRHDYLVECVRQDEQAKLMTRLNFSDSVTNKKKVLPSAPKLYRSAYLKRIASL